MTDHDRRGIDLCTCGHGRDQHAITEADKGTGACLGGRTEGDYFICCACLKFFPHPQPKADPTGRLTQCRKHRETYIEYAKQRIQDEDWHGLSDAANDLRELDVEIRMLEGTG